jgi:hypothetical protein
MPTQDQIIDAAMASGLQADAIRTHPLVAWIVTPDEVESKWWLRRSSWTAGCPDIRQNPVGEPAATAAPPRRSGSVKRLCPFPHCRQRYERNLRRIHASRSVSTRGAEAEVAAPSDKVWRQLLDVLAGYRGRRDFPI